MKRSSALAGLLLAVCALACAQETTGDRVVVPARNTSHPRVVNATVHEGSITVKTYSGNEVIVETGRAHADKRARRDEAHRFAQGPRRGGRGQCHHRPHPPRRIGSPDHHRARRYLAQPQELQRKHRGGRRPRRNRCQQPQWPDHPGQCFGNGGGQCFQRRPEGRHGSRRPRQADVVQHLQRPHRRHFPGGPQSQHQAQNQSRR